MAQQKISLSDIVFGQPLPWDLYVASDRLLLRKGHVLVSSVQFKRLLDTGLFADMGDPAASSGSDAANGQSAGGVPVLRAINNANKQLEHLLHVLNLQANAQAEILEVANTLMTAAEANPDIALASVLLNQIAGGYAVRHCIETAIVSLLVAREMGKPPEEILIMTGAALTMNVGMLRYHEQLQSKRSGLSDHEISEIRRHPEEGAELLKNAGITDMEWLSYVLLHHENDDGSGYPLGKSSEEIPQNARLISLADRYCAQVSARNYRKSILPHLALRDIFLAGNKAADPELATHFVRVLGSYPPGTYVRLKNGEIGVVFKKGESDLCPIVKAVVGADDKSLPVPIERSCSDDAFAVQEVLHEDDVGHRFSMKQVWGEQASL